MIPGLAQVDPELAPLLHSLARSYLYEWVRFGTGASPMDRRPAEWWDLQFTGIGPFVAKYGGEPAGGGLWRAFLDVDLTDPGSPEPGSLLRASLPAHRDRWSWTTSPQAALHYNDRRGGVSFWTCEPRRIFGRIDNVAPEFSVPGAIAYDEWVVEPDPATIRQVDLDSTK